VIDKNKFNGNNNERILEVVLTEKHDVGKRISGFIVLACYEGNYKTVAIGFRRYYNNGGSS